MPALRTRPHRAWAVCLGCSIALFTVMGLGVNVFTIYQPWIIQVHGFTNAQGSWITTVRSLFALLAMLSVDGLCRRLGLRYTMTAGMACFAASYALFGAARTFPVYCAAAALSGLAYGYGGMIPLTLVISNWFQRRRGLALGLAAAGSGLSTILFPPLLTQVLEQRELETALCGEAVLGVLLTVTVFLLVRSTPAQVSLAPYAGGQEAQPEMPAVRSAPAGLRPIHWWAVAVAAFLIGAPSGPGFSHLTVLYTSCGYDSILVAFLMSYLGVVLMAAKVIYGQLSDKLGSRTANLLVFLVMLAGFLLCALAPLGSVPLAFAAITLTALGMPISSVTLSVWAGDLSGQDTYQCTVKWYTSAYMLGSLATGPLPGLSADRLGSYVPAYLLFALMLLAAAVLVQGVYRRLDLGKRPR